MTQEPQANMSLEIARDYLAKDRTVLANERTLLAFARTALMLFATGVTFIKFFDEDPVTLGMGWALAILAFPLMAFGCFRHWQVVRHLNLNYPHLGKGKSL